jgi:hypothetical protein
LTRGLGDSPLKKRERGRRATQKVVHADSSPEGSQENASTESPNTALGEVTQAVPTTTSYNDVFFQRRPEVTSDTAATDTDTAGASEVSTAREVVGPTAVTPVVSAVPVETLAAVESPPEAVIAPTSLETPPRPEEPAPAPQVAEVVEVAPPAPTHVAPAAPQATEVQTVRDTAPEQKSGFFGRIFGKFKKS